MKAWPIPGPVFRAAKGHAPAHHRFDLGLEVVRELEAVAAEDLDAVVLEGIVAGADHDAEIGAHARGEMGHRGCGNGPGEDHVSAHRADPRGEGGFDHVAGKPGVLADEDPGWVLDAHRGHRDRGLADAEGHFRGHGLLVRHAAHAVGAEQPGFSGGPLVRLPGHLLRSFSVFRIVREL